MGCFLACFGTKEKKHPKPASKTLPRSRSNGSYVYLPQTCSPEQQEIETHIDSFPVSRDKPEELSLSSRRKVTFDLNVKSYSTVYEDEDLNSSFEKDQSKESDHEESIRKGAESVTSSGDSDNSTKSNTSSYPPTHRYQNCRCSYDESNDDDDDVYEDEDDYYDEGEGDDEELFESEESFESYFSYIDGERISSIPGGKQEINSKSIYDCPEDEKSILPVNLNGRDRSQYVHSVLNPVENLSQWKALKHKDPQLTPLKQHMKENSVSELEMQIPFSSEPSFKLPMPQIPIKSDPGFNNPKPDKKQEISVDASLSNWLIPSEINKYQGMSSRTNSPTSQDDRPILGALTVEEINWASPRRSPCRSASPDEIPILGTVGTYWNHNNQAMDSSPHRAGLEITGIPNTTSKYKEDKRVNWYSTPFEVRLERALTKSAAEAYSSYPPQVC